MDSHTQLPLSGQAARPANRWTPPWWFSGAVALSIIAAATLLPLMAMVSEAGTIDWADILGNRYMQRVITFSFTQAALSTVLSVLLAIPVALALAHSPTFPGRRLIINLFSLSLVIPTIVAIYGIVAVFGRSGWISALSTSLSLPPLSIYGLPGILIAHVFFNMPLVARIVLVNLQNIPAENWRLARQLGMGPLSVLRYIEWPAIRNQLAGLALLVFTLCFTSFAIVMTLGGGPRATTIEVAIYQALRFDFDINLAVALAIVQLLVCIAFMALSTLSAPERDLGFSTPGLLGTQSEHSTKQQEPDPLWASRRWQLLHGLIITTASVFVLLPLLALALSAFNGKTLSVLLDAHTIGAAGNTVMAAMSAAVLAQLLGIGLLISTRHLRIRLHRDRPGQWLQLAGNIILVLPPLVLGTGLFLLLRPFADVFSLALMLVILINSLMALPFVLRILDGPVMQSANQHDRLIQSLGLRGWSRWRWIDWPQLKRPVALSLALSATLSAGDLSAIALFGSERVRTLPLLLYQRMGSYQLEEAAVTAGVLLLLCLILFSSIQWLIAGARRADS